MKNKIKPDFLNHIIELGSVDSTNDYAGELVKKSLVKEGTVIWAHLQTDGRGQGENIWESENGMNLTFSVILMPRFLTPERQFLLNMAISLGVLDFIRTLEIMAGFSLKWPNDIYAGKNKLGGILINNTINGPTYTVAVVGIGLNINQIVFPKELPNPVSLKLLSGKTFPLKSCLDNLLACLSMRYIQLRTSFEQVIKPDYKKCLLGYNEERTYSHAGKHFPGMIRGVDEFGRLLVETKDKGILIFNHKEIEFIL